jgi:hypothetical protein
MLAYFPRRELADRSRAFRLLLEYNPCYVLSAMFMLGGLLALNDSLDWSPLPVGNVLILIATLNVYEMLLIAVAVLLYIRGIRRDATMLLVIEAFFLVDAGFLNAEVITQDLHLGIFVNIVLLVSAAAKLGVVFHVLHLPVRSTPYLLAMLQLGLLTTMPAVFKWYAKNHDGRLPGLAIYGFWWAVAALVALYGPMLRWTDFSGAPRIDAFGRHRVVVGAFLGLGFVSVVTHLAMSSWVYDVSLHAADVAPVLLGLAVMVASVPSGVLKYRKRMRVEFALPLAAIGMSMSFPDELAFRATGFELGPLRLILLGSALAYLHGLWLYRQIGFAWMSAGCLGAAALGSSVAVMVQNLVIINRAAADWIDAMTPRRPVHWGLLSVMSSFALLVIGLLLSLMKGARMDESRL